MPQFQLLGTAAGTGVPSFFCQCASCQEARHDTQCARTRSGALLRTGRRTLLIDASPDLRFQLLREGVCDLDGILLTHWHYDHYSGLGELEYYVKLQHLDPIPLYLPPSARESFAEAYPNLSDVLDVIPWEFFKPYYFDDIAVTPLPAAHGIETAGFLVETGRSRLAYFPDTAIMPPESRGRIQGVDWFCCDATFNGDNWYPHSHLSVKEAIILGKRIGARQTILTHLSMHYSQAITTRELDEIVAGYSGVAAARDGMAIDL